MAETKLSLSKSFYLNFYEILTLCLREISHGNKSNSMPVNNLLSSSCLDWAMVIHQLWIVIQFLANSLFHFGHPENIFNKQNKAFFIRDNYCHLMLSLHEVEPNYSDGILKDLSTTV